MSSIHQQTTLEIYKWQDWPVACKSRNFSLLMLSALSSSLSSPSLNFHYVHSYVRREEKKKKKKEEEEERRKKKEYESISSHFRLRGTNCANTKLKYPAR